MLFIIVDNLHDRAAIEKGDDADIGKSQIRVFERRTRGLLILCLSKRADLYVRKIGDCLTLTLSTAMLVVCCPGWKLSAVVVCAPQGIVPKAEFRLSGTSERQRGQSGK